MLQGLCGWKVGRDDAARFWHDEWMGNFSLKNRFKRNFFIACNKDAKVEVMYEFVGVGRV